MKENKKRGHIKSYSKFDLNENTFLDLQIERSTDRNYLNTYRYKPKDILESSIKLGTHRNGIFIHLIIFNARFKGKY